MSLKNATLKDDDDELKFEPLSSNVFMRKIHRHLPAGSWKILYAEKDGTLAIELLATRTIISMERGLTWKQIKKILDKDRGLPEDYECPICCLNPTPAVLSTCDICGGDMCMKCFVNMFEKSCGRILCPFCRDDIGNHALSPEHCDYICAKMRKDYCIN
jgi:hypothetical protein